MLNYEHTRQQRPRRKGSDIKSEKWISTKDRLPNNNEFYLVVRVGYTPHIAMYARSTFQWFADDGNTCLPTHWMPLPEPPLND